MFLTVEGTKGKSEFCVGGFEDSPRVYEEIY